ncbi:transcriptional regulator [Hahella sp. KA22]|nr:transcriptional regulator [Hahella sp. KA22]QAY52755.1 transcriptional regulator [Hahella sp. KA22]
MGGCDRANPVLPFSFWLPTEFAEGRMYTWNDKPYRCPVEIAFAAVGGKWKCLILWHLHLGKMRFKELERIVPGVSQKMLTQQLKEMERDGLIVKTVFPEIPPKVEYELTERGHSIFPILEQMHEWAIAQFDLKKSAEEE